MGWFKKILVLAIMLITINGFASVTELCETYVVENRAAGTLTTYVSTSTIIPGIHKILSFSVTPVPGTSTASGAAIYDATAAGDITNANMKGEVETISNVSNDRIFPYPKHLSKGLAVVQTDQTIVTIEYVR